MSAQEARARIVASAPRNSDRIAAAYGITVGEHATAEELAGLARGMRTVLATLDGDRRLWHGLIATGTLAGYALGVAQGHVEAATSAADHLRAVLATVLLP